jgi:hypothetical protein
MVDYDMVWSAEGFGVSLTIRRSLDANWNLKQNVL